MSKATKKFNPVILRRGMTVGSNSAEYDDDFLFDCFVHYPPVDECLRIQSSTMIVSGRTGAGKTAILRYIHNSEEHSVEIDPTEMSMSYVSNSDALQFLQAIGADLDLLFQVLWKHVLCIEFIRLRWNVENEEKSKSIFSRITSKFYRDERKTKAVEYLKEWEGKFWITMDQNIKEITERYERKINAELGVDIKKFKAGGQYDKRISAEKKSELVARARKIIDATQLSDLHQVIEMLSVGENHDSMNKYYILIDKLDERWVDTNIRFRMIRALIESLAKFRKINNLKILVSMRIDVFERVVQETKDLTFQREKFDSYSIRLKWSKKELKELVDKRIRLLFKRQYSSEDIEYNDIFPNKIGNQDSFDYLIERTLLRPRDIIAFINECISFSENSNSISVSHIRDAEREYSRIRLLSLEQEWQSAFPSLRKVIDFISKKKIAYMNIKDIGNDGSIDDLALSICSDQKIDFDPFYEVSKKYIEEKNSSSLEYSKEIIVLLYRVGAVGVKLSPDERYVYSHIDTPLLHSSMISDTARVAIHPMLWAAYRLRDSSHSRY